MRGTCVVRSIHLSNVPSQGQRSRKESCKRPQEAAATPIPAFRTPPLI
jgi:hypothetical protein